MMGCRETMRVNRQLLPVKAAYFFKLAAVGSLLPYIAVFMRQLGLRPSEVSTIYGTTPFLAALVRPFFGILADKLRRHTLVMIICAILTSIFAGFLLLVPPVARETPVMEIPVEFNCEQPGTYLIYCHQSNLEDMSECLESQLNHTHEASNSGYLVNEGMSEYCELSCNVREITSTICLLYNQSSPDHCQVAASIQNDSYIHMDVLVNLGDIQTNEQCRTMNIYHGKQGSTNFRSPQCVANLTIFCWLDCPYEKSGHETQCDIRYEGKAKQFSKTFWIFALIFFLMNICFAPVLNLLDALTYSHLGEQREKWGNQRVWGTIGFALFGVSAGFLMDTYKSKHGDIDYSFCFILFIIHCLLAATAAFFYKTKDVHCTNAWAKLKEVLSRLEVMALFLLLLLFGMFAGVIETFLFWHLQMLGAPQLLLGLTMVMNCTPEIFIMYILGYVIKFLGESICLYSVCFAYVLRFLGYSFLVNPWFVLFIEPLHGFTYAIMYGAASSYGSRVTPPGMHGTVQAIIASLHFGFGKGIGSLVGGPVFEQFGAVRTFQGCAALAFLGFLLYFPMQIYLARRRPSDHSKDESEKEDEPSVDTKMIAADTSMNVPSGGVDGKLVEGNQPI